LRRKPEFITLAFVFWGRSGGGVRRYETYLQNLLEKSNDNNIAVLDTYDNAGHQREARLMADPLYALFGLQ
jgi:hypothetical protein